MADILDTWFNGAPVIEFANDQQFDNWFDGAPVIQFVFTTTSLTGLGGLTLSGSGSISCVVSGPVSLGSIALAGVGSISVTVTGSTGAIALGPMILSGRGVIACAVSGPVALGSVALAGQGSITATVRVPGTSLGFMFLDGVGAISCVLSTGVSTGGTYFPPSYFPPRYFPVGGDGSGGSTRAGSISAKARIVGGRSLLQLTCRFEAVVPFRKLSLLGQFNTVYVPIIATISARARISNGGTAQLGGMFIVRTNDENSFEMTTRVFTERTILAKARII